MRAAHNAGRPSAGNGASMIDVRFLVERMHITSHGRTWHLVDEPHRHAELAHQAADKLRQREAFTVRVRPVVL